MGGKSSKCECPEPFEGNTNPMYLSDDEGSQGGGARRTARRHHKARKAPIHSRRRSRLARLTKRRHNK